MTASDEQPAEAGCTCSMGGSCPYCERVLAARRRRPDDRARDEQPAEGRVAMTFSAGQILGDELVARGIPRRMLQRPLGLSLDQIDALLDGSLPFTAEIAEALGGFLGTSAQLWINLDRIHRAAQPAPAGDDELREAERMARVKQYASWVLMAEYDRRGDRLAERGRELERLREENRQLVDHVKDGTEKQRLLIEERDVLSTLLRGMARKARHLAESRAAAIERLRARDEKAAAVAQWWDGLDEHQKSVVRLGDRRKLDELARAHGADEQDGGQDR